MDFVNLIPSYPRKDDPLFSKKIAEKEEFKRKEEGLFAYQSFVRAFLSQKTPYQELILFHNMGSGKTLSSIAVAESYRSVFSSPPLVLVRGESSMNNFKSQIIKFFGKSEAEREYDMRTFISFARKLVHLTDENIFSEHNARVIIIDEVQNTRSSEQTQGFVYEQIKRLINVLHERVVVLLTGTPMIDKAQEVCGVMNLILKNPLLKDDLSNKNIFFEKTRGYISFVETNLIEGMPNVIDIGEKVPPLNIKVIVSKMKGTQASAYQLSYANKGAIYRNLIYSSLFVLPNGEYGDDAYMLVNSPDTSPHFSESIRFMLLKNYQNYSCKMHAAMEIISYSPGPVFVFCEEVKGSGLIMIAALLEALGYSPYRGENITSLNVKKRYTIFVGDKSICPNANERLSGFCSDKNIKGEYVKILLGSRISGEGINLKNVRQVHIMTPHWNAFSTKQAIARAVRLDSHLLLKEEDRNVCVYRHVAVLDSFVPERLAICSNERAHTVQPFTQEELSHKSIDMHKYFVSQEKEKEILIIKKWMSENSVDKYLYSPSKVSRPCEDVKNETSKVSQSFWTFIKHDVSEYFLRKDKEKRRIKHANNMFLSLIYFRPNIKRALDKIKDSTEEIILWSIETDIIEKMLILEECLSAIFTKSVSPNSKEGKIVRFFHRSIAKTNCLNKPFVHILLCRIPNEASSYSISSSSLKSNGRVRVFFNENWSFFDQERSEPDEWIINVFEKENEKMIRELSKNGMYMIVSNGDNSIRIIFARDSSSTLKDEDLRRVPRGKRIESFSSSELLDMISFLESDFSRVCTRDGSLSKKEMKKILIKLFVSEGRYIVL